MVPHPAQASSCAASQRVAELEALEAIAAFSLTKKGVQKLFDRVSKKAYYE